MSAKKSDLDSRGSEINPQDKQSRGPSYLDLEEIPSKLDLPDDTVEPLMIHLTDQEIIGMARRALAALNEAYREAKLVGLQLKISDLPHMGELNSEDAWFFHGAVRTISVE